MQCTLIQPRSAHVWMSGLLQRSLCHRVCPRNRTLHPRTPRWHRIWSLWHPRHKFIWVLAHFPGVLLLLLMDLFRLSHRHGLLVCWAHSRLWFLSLNMFFLLNYQPLPLALPIRMFFLRRISILHPLLLLAGLSPVQSQKTWPRTKKRKRQVHASALPLSFLDSLVMVLTKRPSNSNNNSSSLNSPLPSSTPVSAPSPMPLSTHLPRWNQSQSLLPWNWMRQWLLHVLQPSLLLPQPTPMFPQKSLRLSSLPSPQFHHLPPSRPLFRLPACPFLPPQRALTLPAPSCQPRRFSQIHSSPCHLLSRALSRFLFFLLLMMALDSSDAMTTIEVTWATTFPCPVQGHMAMTNWTPPPSIMPAMSLKLLPRMNAGSD